MELSDASSSLQGSPENDRTNGSLDGDFLLDNEYINKDYEEGCTLEADHGSLPAKCSLCNKRFSDPVVLSCLHVFDLTCLREKKAANVKAEDGSANGHDGIGALDVDEKVNIDAILNGNSMYSPTICPLCRSSSGHLDSLPGYYLFDSNHVGKNESPKSEEVDGSGDSETMTSAPTHLQCTMCTKGVEAMAKCTDCAEFMCSGCIGAHQSMRLFAGHKWTQLTDEEKNDMASVSKNISKNKPIKCRTHPTEQCKLFCIQCCVLICSDCMALDHKQHVCERVSDVGGRLKNEILQIRDEAKKSINSLKEVAETLTSMLGDVALSRDNNRSNIEETFQSYKAILQDVKEKTLKQNKEIHDSVEMEILDRINQIDKTCEQFEYASEFLGNYIDNGSSTHLASVMKPLRERILHLSREKVDTNVETNIPFHTDCERFKSSVELDFGWLGHTHAAPVCTDVANGAVESLAAAATLWPLNSSGPGNIGAELLTNGTTYSSVPSTDPSSDIIAGLPFNSLSTPGELGTVGPLGADFNLPPLPGQRAITSHLPESVESGSPTLNGGSPTGLNPVNLQGANPNDMLLGGNVPNTSSNSISLSSSNMTSGAGSASVTGISRGLSGLNFNQSTSNDMIVSPSCALGSMASSSAVTTGSASNTPRGPTPASGLDAMSSVGDSTLMNSAVSMVGSSILPSAGVSGASGGSCLPPAVINQPLAKPGGSSGYNPNPNPPFPNRGNRCSQMNVRFRWGQLGSARGQFNSPHGFCLGFEEEIVVADTQNHRIQIFDKEGTQRGCFGVAGREEGQLWYPRKVAIMRQSQKYVICDRGNERSRMQIFTRSGHFVKKIAIRYIDIVAGLAINSYGHIVAVDSVSPTVFVISEAGDLIKWFDCSDYMREPSDIAVSGREYFICDFKGHCVAVFQEDGTFMRRIGSETITNFPNGIDISDAGDVLIGDSHGNRFHVAVYSRVGELMSEFECLQFKVSRCCGLKITSEGYIVTLAKNNHHVLVLNTLYIA